MSYAAEVGGIGATGIELRLPASQRDLCRGQTLLSGTLLGPDGEPIEGFGIGLIEAEPRGFWPRKWRETGLDESFRIRLLYAKPVPLSWEYMLTKRTSVPFATSWDFYGLGGFTTLGDAATLVDVGGTEAARIEIRLPASTDQLLPARVGSNFCGGPAGRIS